jgi:hypothetical protein
LHTLAENCLILKQDIRLQRSFACVFITHVQSFGTICRMPNALYIQNLM